MVVVSISILQERSETVFIQQKANESVIHLINSKGDLILLLCHKVDQNEECTESHNSLKSTENEKNSFLIDFVTTALEKPQESQVTVGDVEEEKEKAHLIMKDDLTAEDTPLLQLQSILCTESSKVFI